MFSKSAPQIRRDLRWVRLPAFPIPGRLNTRDQFVEHFEQRVMLSAWYVATNGSSSNPGTLAQPFATIQEAANVAQAGDIVLIRGGTYHETVSPVNSGTAAKPILFEPYNNESVTIDGADAVTGWASYKGKIYDAPQGWDLGEGNNQVFVDGVMVNEARYPNSVLNPSTPTWTTASSVKVTQSTTGGLSSVTLYNSGLTEAAGTLVGTIAHLAAGQEWVDQTGLITANSPGSITVSYFNETVNEVPKAGNRFYIVGSFQTLDSAGEWYRDPTSGSLYLWDPAGDSPASHTVEAKARQYGFDLSGDSYIDVEGINLFACTVNTDSGSNHILLDHLNATYVSHSIGITQENQNPWSNVHYAHNTGIIFNGQFDVIQNSTIAYSSGDGVFLGGSNNTVQNCLIHDIDYEAGDDAAVDTQNTLQHIFYNTVYNTGRCGILIRMTTASQVEHNNIYNIGTQMTDLGAIYEWGSNGGGTEIAYNTINNVHTGGLGGAGVYLDNISSNYIIDHNVVWNCDFACKLNAPSNNNQVYNNTFEGTKYGLQSSNNEDMTGSVIENNIFNPAVMFGPGLTQSHNILVGTNPLFVNTAQNNYQLQSTSPAINAGMVIAPYTNGYVGSAPDIGAYEYGAAPFTSGYTPTAFTSVTLSNPTIALSGNSNANPGAAYSLNLGAVTDPGFSASQYIVHWGDGSKNTYTAAGIVTHPFSNGTSAGIVDTITVDVVDNSGAGGSARTTVGAGALNLTINPSPTIALSGLASANVDGVYQLSLGTPVDPGFTISQLLIDWGDGTPPSALAAGTISATHIYTSIGASTISAALVDNSGTYSGAGALAINVVSQPTVTLTGNSAGFQGQAYSLTISSPVDIGGTPQQYTVHWGDSTSTTYAVSNPASSVVATHVYVTPQSPTITVDLGDNTGSYASVASLPITILAPTTVTLTGASTVMAGNSYELSLTGDTDPSGTISSFVIHWGDNSTTTTIDGSLGDIVHTYANGGSPTITVDTVDENGTFVGAGSLPLTVTVPPTAPTLLMAAPVNANAGGTYNLTLGPVNDSNGMPSQYIVHWGDTPSDISTYTTLGAFTHTYASPGSASIAVDVVDAAGTWTAVGAASVVINSAPTVTVSGSATANAGSAYTLNLGAATDPGYTPSQYTIHWGDGTPNTTAAGGSVTHTFAKAGPDSITVDLTDQTGTYSSAGALNLSVLNPSLFTTSADIGAPAIAGSASLSNGTYTVTGSGTDIWNASDQFHYDYTSATGDTTISAKVASVQNINAWSKAGVMIRNGTAANAAFADIVVTPGGYTAFQWRAKAGGGCAQAVLIGKFAPEFVKLVRKGNVFTAYYSANGTTWTQLGTSQTIAMSTTVTTGLAVTSILTSKSCTATFTNVIVTHP